MNGDGKITLDDQQVIGNTLPIHTGGFGLNAGWKGIDLNVNFNWSYGNKVLNAGKMEYSTLQGSKKYNNLISDMKLDNRFTTIDPETGKNIYYGADANPDLLRELNQGKTMWNPILNYSLLHSWAVEDGSFLRLNTLTLGYTIPAKITNKVKIQALRLFVTAYNLYCWTNYSGQDPEVSTRNTNSSASLTPGVDYSAYPKAHQYLFGVNLTF